MHDVLNSYNILLTASGRFRLHNALDEIEDENEMPTPSNITSIIMHPPGNGSVSDAESGDEDCPSADHLPKSVLETEVELQQAAEEENDEGISYKVPFKSSKKKTCQWAQANEMSTPEFNEEFDKSDIFLESGNAIDYFYLFWDDEVFDFILQQSIEYSGIAMTRNELESVFGVLAASGVISPHRRRDYWSSHKLKRNELISDSISRNRFEEIFSKLHFVPIDAVSSNDKFQKIRLLITKLNKRFMQHAPNTNCFSVDESIVPYFGRHGCKQFIRGKPIRFGFKMWVTATTSGYCFHLQPYPGVAEKSSEEYNHGSSGNVIYYMANALRQKYEGQISISMDNYFTSLALLKALKENLDVIATGTIRRNRVPSCPVKEEKKDRGSFESYFSDDHSVFLTAWEDNKTVLVASSGFAVSPIKNASRYCRKEKKRISISRPAAISHYNRTMGGVDLLDR